MLFFSGWKLPPPPNNKTKQRSWTSTLLLMLHFMPQHAHLACFLVGSIKIVRDPKFFSVTHIHHPVTIAELIQ